MSSICIKDLRAANIMVGRLTAAVCRVLSSAKNMRATDETPLVLKKPPTKNRFLNTKRVAKITYITHFVYFILKPIAMDLKVDIGTKCRYD